MAPGDDISSKSAKPDALLKKKKKRKSPEKKLPFKSSKFETLVSFDIFDFVQFKTQMKIIKLKAQERREGVQDLTDLIAQIPSSKKRKLKKSRSSTIKINRKDILKREIRDKDIEAFLMENEEIKSRKRAKAHIKTKEYITEYLKRHPKIPVEKSHRSMRPWKYVQSQQTTSSEELLKKPNPTKPLVKEPLAPSKSPVLLGQQQLHGGHSPTPMPLERVDHVAAISAWVQKNYPGLNPPQKQLVHMQLQYLNNLKKTSFQNQAFILTPQHLNNLNNVAFLHANFNPFNNNYTNFVSIPSYSMDTGQTNIQLMNTIQQQQQKQNPYRVQMPLSFLGDAKDSSSSSQHGNLNFGEPK